MNHFGSRVVSLLLAVLFLLGAAGVSFYAVFKGTLVFAADLNIEIKEIVGNDSKLDSAHDQRIVLQFTDTSFPTDVTGAKIEFDSNQCLRAVAGDIGTFKPVNGSSHEFEVDIQVRLSKPTSEKVTGKITIPNGTTTTEKSFNLELSGWLPSSESSSEPEPGTNPDLYNLQSYRFYDSDGDLITALKKGRKIEKLVLTIRDGGFTAARYNEARSQHETFSASLNYSTFELRDRDTLPKFGPAEDLDNGLTSYTVTFYDLRYTGESKELQVKIGYPKTFGLERREFTETLPEGELYVKDTSSSSSEESSSEVEIDPPTPRLIIKSYDYGGENVAAASTATLTMTFQNVSRRVPVDNVVVKVTMPEAFTLADSSNSFYFERIGREREQTISINFTVKPTAEAISQAIKLNFAYEAVIANKRTQLTSDEEIAIPVSQVNRMMLNAVESPPEIYIGDNSGSLEASFVNKGKTAVYNVSVSIEGENLAQVGQNQFIGNVESGIEKSADFTLEALEPGPVKGEIILTYEDANMHVTELRTPFSTNAIEMDTGPTPEELEAMNKPPAEPVESAAWYETIPMWYWAVGGLVALIALAYLIKLTRVSRLTILEDDDEDF